MPRETLALPAFRDGYKQDANRPQVSSRPGGDHRPRSKTGVWLGHRRKSSGSGRPGRGAAADFRRLFEVAVSGGRF